MFDIGFTEILLIAVVALVVLGPEKLPVAIRTVGLWVGKVKRTVSGIQTEISEELRLDEMKRTAAVAKEQLDSELEEMRNPFVSESDATTVNEKETASSEASITTPSVVENVDKDAQPVTDIDKK
ncbi:MAG: twin-arginine translocase subunit TatB [Amylibacter sp.]|jgi:sec-independent protein translocase protein TatB|nr:twin-arginine translocase subunit TatB [Amylibacter sp.]